MLREIARKGTDGIAMLLVSLAIVGLGVERLAAGARLDAPAAAVLGAVAIVLGIFLMAGLFAVQPNEGRVLTLFGRYVGTVRESGLFWANPFYAKKRVSLRVRNFETAKLKVDDYTHFVVMQSEAAIRALAQSYPYDAHGADEIALSTHVNEVSVALQQAVADRLNKAGVEVIEARISHLAYAPEIASAMLRRQQASAIIAARQKIVDGAVGMVESALTLIGDKGLMTLDEERKASMVSNLLVVLCSDRDAQPVVNTGTIYH